MTALAPTRNVTDRDSAGGASGRGFDVVRIALAAILLAAAALKAHQLATEPLAGKDIFSYRWPLMAQVEFEIVLGAWLLSGLFRRLAWAATLACFVLFCGVTLYKALSGAASCGCFGRVQVSPWYTLILDVWAVAALLVFPPKAAPAAPGRNSRRRLLATALATLLVAVPTGVAMGSYQPAQLADDGGLTTAGRFVLLEPERWVGKRFPLLEHLDIGQRLAKGAWIVLFKHDGCPGCAEAVPRYQRLAADLTRQNSPISVAMIELEPTKAQRAAAARAVAGAAANGLVGIFAGRPWTEGLLPAEQEWFVTTPAVVVLRAGQVLAGWEAKAPKTEQLMKPLGTDDAERADSTMDDGHGDNGHSGHDHVRHQAVDSRQHAAQPTAGCELRHGATIRGIGCAGNGRSVKRGTCGLNDNERSNQLPQKGGAIG